MDQIKVSSGGWTGSDPRRNASRGISPATRLKMARLLFAIGGFGLFLLGYEFATFSSWTELVIPAALALQGFSFGTREWRLGSEGG